MADNITIPASGTGTATPSVATDDVGGAHYQKVKLDLGGDGASSPVVGTVPVSGTVGVSGTVTVGVSGTVTVDGSAATQPVSHAALTELAAAIDTELQVDVVGALPAGNNNIGDVDVATLPALPAGTNNIGDVDVLTVPSPLSTAGNGTAATAHRVTIASDSTGVVGLAAGTNAIGKLAANSGVDIGDVDVTSLPALPAGTNNIGDVDVVTLPGVGGDVAHDGIDSGNPVKIGGKANSSSPTSVASGDRVDAWMSVKGATVIAAGSRGTPGDGFTNASGEMLLQDPQFQGGRLAILPTVFNGTSWDRLRGDTLGLHISKAAQAATATLSNVNDTNVSTTLLAANTSRKGATIHNDSTAILYVKFGATASSTSYTVKMVADAYYEVPFGYTGIIDGIWASDAAGAARITEMT